MLSGNDGREFPFVHDEYKPAEYVKKENAIAGSEGDLESFFGSTVESHEDILEVRSIYNESSNCIDSSRAISQRLEEKVSNDVTSTKFVQVTVLVEKMS